jgi:chaperonin GroES
MQQDEVRIRPVGNQVAMMPIEDADKTPGGIIIPNTQKNPPIKGQVVAVGPGEYQGGKRRKPMVKRGDIVMWRKDARNGAPATCEIRVAGETVVITDECNILAIVEESDLFGE